MSTAYPRLGKPFLKFNSTCDPYFFTVIPQIWSIVVKFEMFINIQSVESKFARWDNIQI